MNLNEFTPMKQQRLTSSYKDIRSFAHVGRLQNF